MSTCAYIYRSSSGSDWTFLTHILLIPVYIQSSAIDKAGTTFACERRVFISLLLVRQFGGVYLCRVVSKISATDREAVLCLCRSDNKNNNII